MQLWWLQSYSNNLAQKSTESYYVRVSGVLHVNKMFIERVWAKVIPPTIFIVDSSSDFAPLVNGAGRKLPNI